jgi:thiosulfate dehydrogenase [quinone] large subunit
MDLKGTSYFLGRLVLGMAMFGHGLIRFAKMPVFVNGMVKEFSQSLLPGALVWVFACALPFFEFFTGLFLLVGLFTRFAAIQGVCIMLALILGSCFIEKWDNVFTQVIYGAYFVLLLLFSDNNKYALDGLRNRNK